MATIRPIIFVGLGDYASRMAGQIYGCLKEELKSPVGELSVAFGIGSDGKMFNFHNDNTVKLVESFDKEYKAGVFKANHDLLYGKKDIWDKVWQEISQHLTRITFHEDKRIDLNNRFNTPIEAEVEWIILAPLFDPVGSAILLPMLQQYCIAKSDFPDMTGSIHTYLLCPDLYGQDSLLEADGGSSYANARTYASLSELEYLLIHEGNLDGIYNMSNLTTGAFDFFIIDNKFRNVHVTHVDRLVKPIATILDIINFRHTFRDYSTIHGPDTPFNTFGYSEIDLGRAETQAQFRARFKQYVITKYMNSYTAGAKDDYAIADYVSNLFQMAKLPSWPKMMAGTPGGDNIYEMHAFHYDNKDEYVENFLKNVNDQYQDHINQKKKWLKDQELWVSGRVVDFKDKLEQSLKKCFFDNTLSSDWHKSYFKTLIGFEIGDSNSLFDIEKEIHSLHDDWFEGAENLNKRLEKEDENIRALEADDLNLNEFLRSMPKSGSGRRDSGVSEEDVRKKRSLIEEKLREAKKRFDSLKEMRFDIDLQVKNGDRRDGLIASRVELLEGEAKELENQIRNGDDKVRDAKYKEKEAVQFRNRWLVRFAGLIPAAFMIIIAIYGILMEVGAVKSIGSGLGFLVKYGLIVLALYYIVCGIYFVVVVDRRRKDAEKRYLSEKEVMEFLALQFIGKYKQMCALEIDSVHWTTALSWIKRLISEADIKRTHVAGYFEYLRRQLSESEALIERGDDAYEKDNMVFENVASAAETEYLLKKFEKGFEDSKKAFVKQYSMYDFYEDYVKDACPKLDNAVEDALKSGVFDNMADSVEDYFVQMDKARFEKVWKRKLEERIQEPIRFLSLERRDYSTSTKVIRFTGIHNAKRESFISLINSDVMRDRQFDPESRDKIRIICITPGFAASNISHINKFHRDFVTKVNSGELMYVADFGELLPTLLYNEKTQKADIEYDWFRLFLLCRFLGIVRYVRRPRSLMQVTKIFYENHDILNFRYELDLEAANVKEHIVLGDTVRQAKEELRRLDDKTNAVFMRLIRDCLRKLDDDVDRDGRIREALRLRPFFSRMEAVEVERLVRKMLNNLSAFDHARNWEEVLGKLVDA